MSGLNNRKRDQRAKYTERNRPVFWRPIGECMEPRPQQQKPSPDKQKKNNNHQHHINSHSGIRPSGSVY